LAAGAFAANAATRAACATCHGEVARYYAETGMGRSFLRPARASTIENYSTPKEFYHSLSDTHYSMRERGGKYYQRRWQSGFDGKETNVEELSIDYVLGSGNHARSYLHRTSRGALIELPLGWYAENGGNWGMSPGFDSRHPATRRLLTYECVFCHNGYPNIPKANEAPGAEPVFSAELPQGIDCQRCHGPGDSHIELASRGAPREQVRASIVNPARLAPKLRMDVCLQCHLETTSTAFPAIIRRYDRGPFSFRPGESLSAFLLSFDHAPGTGHDDKFEIVGSSAYRLRRSRCFIESKEKLTCETCHDPHRIPRGEEAVRHYRQACRQCHSAAFDALVAKGTHPAASDCVGCHMPKRRTEDVVHVAMTDHLIQRRPPQNPFAPLAERHPADSEEYRGEVVSYDRQASPLYLALAQVAMKNNLPEGVVELERLLTRQPQTEPEWFIQLGQAWLSNGDPQKAVSAYQRALRLKPKSLRSMEALSRALKAAGETTRASDVLRQAIQLSPTQASAWYHLGMLTLALDSLQKAIALDADLPGAYTTLAAMQASAGHREQTQESLREALRIDPYDAAAWDLAGRASAEKGQFPEALFNFEKANYYRPNFAPYLYDYGVALSNAGELDRAQEMADAALKADPKLAEAHVLCGRLLVAKRRLPEAAAEYREALRLRPDFARLRLDLASTLASAGEMEQAVEVLREAARSGDTEVARLAAEALDRLGRR
jgi:tetratricopeptide (TPR) repeat protein